MTDNDSYRTSIKKNSFELELFSMNEYFISCSNTGSIRDIPYWTSRKKSLELIELSSIDNVSLD